MKGIFRAVSYDVDNAFRCISGDVSHSNTHWHDDIEIIACTAGAMRVTVEENAHTLERGDVLIINPREGHGVSALRSGTTQEVLFVNRDILNLPRNSELRLELPASGSGNDDMYRRILDEVETIRRYYDGGRISDKYTAYAGIYGIFAKLSCREGSAEDGSGHNSDMLNDVLQIINSEYAEPLTIESIARRLHFSPSTLYKLFNRSVGSTFTDYLNYVRIGAAQQMMLRTDDRIIDIMYTCGFSSTTTFYRAFKKYSGMSPNEYRSTSVQRIAV